jgi:hypothetical protein
LLLAEERELFDSGHAVFACKDPNPPNKPPNPPQETPTPSLDFQQRLTDLALMKQLEFTATVGEGKMQVKLTEPQGASAGYQVLIDQWLQGTLIKRNETWTAHLNRKSILSSADIDILGELIDAANANRD